MMSEEQMTPEEALAYALANMDNDDVFAQLDHHDVVRYLYTNTSILDDIECEAIDYAVKNNSPSTYYSWSDVIADFASELDDYADGVVDNFIHNHSLTEIRDEHYSGEWILPETEGIKDFFYALVDQTDTAFPILATAYQECTDTRICDEIVEFEKQKLLEIIALENSLR